MTQTATARGASSGRLIQKASGSREPEGGPQPLGYEGVGGVEDALAILSDHLGQAEVNIGRGVELDARVAVLVVR